MSSRFTSSPSSSDQPSFPLRFRREVNRSIATAAFYGLQKDLISKAVATLKALYTERELFSLHESDNPTGPGSSAGWDPEGVAWETGGYFGLHRWMNEEFQASHRVTPRAEQDLPAPVTLLEMPVGFDPRDLAQSFDNYSKAAAKRRAARKMDLLPQHMSASVLVLDARQFWEQLTDDRPLSVLIEDPEGQEEQGVSRLAGRRKRGSKAAQSSDAVPGLGDELWVADTLVFQLELSNVVLLMHSDSLNQADLVDIEEVISAINPGARILRMTPFDFRLLLGECSRPVSDGALELAKVAEKVGWKQLIERHPIRKDPSHALIMQSGQFIREKHYPRLSEEEGLDWVIFRRRRPFHPGRLKKLLDAFPQGPLRAVGQLWVASFNDIVFSLSLSGPCMMFFFPEGPWTATCSESILREMVQTDPSMIHEWDPIVGDRLTEIVLLCEAELATSVVEQLDWALLTDEEMRMDWKTFEDPIRAFYTSTTHVPDAFQPIVHFPAVGSSTLVSSWRRGPAEKNHLRLVREANLSDLLEDRAPLDS
jgi:G3E family GTPase